MNEIRISFVYILHDSIFSSLNFKVDTTNTFGLGGSYIKYFDKLCLQLSRVASN